MTDGEILFIYGDDPKSRKQARQHVSRVVRRREIANRSEPLFKYEGLPQQPRQSSLNTQIEQNNVEPIIGEAILVSDASRIQARGRKLQGKQHKVNLRTATIKSRESPRTRKSPAASTLDAPKPLSRSPSPLQPHFSAARSDPFCTLPVKLDTQASKALDHFNTSMPYLEFAVYEGAPLIPSRHVAFRSALETPAALHAIVATGATHLASLYGLDTSETAERHIGASLRLLRLDLDRVDANNWNGLAQAMTELAAGDDFRGNFENSRLHLNGLKELMSVYGGIEDLKVTPKIQLLICYVLNGCTTSYFPVIQLSRHILQTLENQRFADHLLFTPSLTVNQNRTLRDLRQHVQAYVELMTKITTFTSKGSFAATLSDVRDNLLPQYFYPGNKLMRLLSKSSNDRRHFGGLGPKGHHRISCLLTIIALIVHYCEAADLQAITLYLDKLQRLHHSNLRLLQFLLLQDGEMIKMHSAKASWEIVRLMQVYKLLGQEWRWKTDQALIRFLNVDTGSIEEQSYPTFDFRPKWTVHEVMAEAVKSVVSVTDKDGGAALGYASG